MAKINMSTLLSGNFRYVKPNFSDLPPQLCRTDYSGMNQGRGRTPKKPPNAFKAKVMRRIAELGATWEEIRKKSGLNKTYLDNLPKHGHNIGKLKKLADALKWEVNDLQEHSNDTLEKISRIDQFHGRALDLISPLIGKQVPTEFAQQSLRRLTDIVAEALRSLSAQGLPLDDEVAAVWVEQLAKELAKR